MQNHSSRRIIVIPKWGLTSPGSSPIRTIEAMTSRLASEPRAAARGRGNSHASFGDLAVVNRSSADGSVLIDADDLSLDDVKALAPHGAKVFEEQWFEMQRFHGAWRAASTNMIKPYLPGQRTRLWTVQVLLDDAGRTPVKDVLVEAYVDAANNRGAYGTTDRYGRVALRLAASTKLIEFLDVSPLHGGWPSTSADVPVGATVHPALVVPIDTNVVDARGHVHGQPGAGAGQGVRVGVVDSGVGRHSALAVARGRNTTSESPRLFSDWSGHGTHVAGVIASSAGGWRRGEAAGVLLNAYRAFEKDASTASSFAISSAIKHAAADGCDLINLSIGSGHADGAIRDAIEQAWALGSVCVAAAGNNGLAAVSYPARFPRCLAVSAFGLATSWPAGAAVDWTLGPHYGRAFAGMPSFLASFSNHGAEVALTAPGVAIVSTIFGDRWGVMNGTSMATPIATGVLARRLAGSPVLAMPRDAARSAAIVALAKAHAEDLGLAATMQGHGIAR